MSVLITISMELGDDHPLLNPIVDQDDLIDALTPDEVAAEWLHDAAGFHVDGDYRLVSIVQKANAA